MNTSEKKKICLEYEIATVETMIALKNMISELGQLLNQEDFSVDDYANKLSAVSDYLRNQNIGKDLVLKAADLIEHQKEICDDFTMEVIDNEVIFICVKIADSYLARTAPTKRSNPFLCIFS